MVRRSKGSISVPLVSLILLFILLSCSFAWAQAPPDAVALAQETALAQEMLTTAWTELLPNGLQAEVPALVDPLLDALSPSIQARAWYCLATVSVYEGDFAGAREKYQQVPALDADLGAQGNLLAAYCLLWQNDLPAAQSEFTALAASTADAETAAAATYQVGETLYRQGRYADALAQFKNVDITTSWKSVAQDKVTDLEAYLKVGGAK
jgi:tetratricopeptide (TPR) repeat protein